MARFKFVLLVVSAYVLTIEAPELPAATYIVGKCKVGTQFTKIQDALNATPAPTIVEVCPGTYAEQLTMSGTVTLEGIVSGNSSFATLVPPSGGLKTNAVLENGDPAAVQILVEDVTGAVNLTNLVVNGSGADVGGAAVVGIYLRNTSGTINHVVTFNVSGGTGGYGIYLAGGNQNPKATVENSTFDHDDTGLWVQSNSTSSELTAIIEKNLISSAGTGINVVSGATVTISNNVINGSGIFLAESAGSVMNNTLVGGFGISLDSDGISVETNKIYNVSLYGIFVKAPLTNSQVTGNILTNIGGVGINLGCVSTGSPNKVHSNTFVDTPTAYAAMPGFPTGGSTFIGVNAEWIKGCT